MCGIAGYFYFQGNSAVTEATLEAMAGTMTHRGPDGGGIWISPDAKAGLAHRRLSIIDLSTSASQPMTNEDRTVWITFNGEIYNHAGLRKELVSAGHRFATDHSDTEVLIHGYEQWGLEGLLARIAGDYAFAIWDTGKRELILARDRIGVKPVYFSHLRDVFVFGSEIKAVLKHPAVSRDIDPMAMYHYLTFMTTPAPMTMFQGVWKLPPGYWMRVAANGKIKAGRYWDATPGQAIPKSETNGLTDAAKEEFYVRGIRDRLTKAVDIRMMSDVPFGVFLSGGIDSSTNVALMSQFTDRPVETFTVGFKDYQHLNELEYAKMAADRFKTNHHEILIEEKDMVGYLSDLVYHQDEPIADWVCIPLYFVSKLCHDNGVKVVQVGEGSDEQFCGYAGYMGYLELYHKYWTPFRRYLPKFARHGAAKAALAAAGLRPQWEVYADIVDRGARDREHFWGGATVFWDVMKRQCVRNGALRAIQPPAAVMDSGLMPREYLEPDSYNVIRSFLEPFDRAFPGADILSRMIYSEFKLRLPELLLMRVDKVGMSVSLEARVPFLDHNLVEFSLDIPMEWKVKNNTAKYLLKKAVEGLIPHELIYRKKMGFGAPMSQWLKGPFGQHVESRILGSKLMSRGYFDTGYIRRLIADHRAGRRENAVPVWVLFNLTAWYDYWVEQPAQMAA